MGPSPFVYGTVDTGTTTVIAPITTYIWRSLAATTVNAPSIPIVDYPPTSYATSPASAVMLGVNSEPVLQENRWRLKFNGKGNSVTFLESLGEITVSHRVASNTSLHYMPELL